MENEVMCDFSLVHYVLGYQKTWVQNQTFHSTKCSDSEKNTEYKHFIFFSCPCFKICTILEDGNVFFSQIYAIFLINVSDEASQVQEHLQDRRTYIVTEKERP